jgi:hypothetical protein
VDLDLDSEVLGEEPTEPLGPRLWRWLRAHPAALALIVVLAIAVAGIGAVILTRPVQPAAVTLVEVTGLDDSPDEPRWLERPDGRPSGRPGLTIDAVLQRAEAGAGADTQIVGITGPGVVSIKNAPTRVPPAGPVGVPLEVVLDCDRLPETVAADAYRLRVAALSGDPLRRPADREVSVQELSKRLVTATRLTCAAWSARRDLTVTAMTATVDPSRPRIAVTFTVANRGARQAFLDRALPGFSIRFEGKLPTPIPPHGTATVSGTVVLDTCDSVKPTEDGLYSLGRGPALSSTFNVAGRSGAAPPDGGPTPAGSSPPGGNGAVEGRGLLEGQSTVFADLESFGVTGILIARDPARTLREALDRACASLRPMLVMIAPGTVRYDARTRNLTVPVRILVGAAVHVRSVQLRSRPGRAATGVPSPGTQAYTPLWKPTGALVPDDTGQVRIDLRYLAPKTGACPESGAYLPDIVATLEVEVAGGRRQMAYSGTPNLFDDPSVPALLCAPQ